LAGLVDWLAYSRCLTGLVRLVVLVGPAGSSCLLGLNTETILVCMAGLPDPAALTGLVSQAGLLVRLVQLG
jgi:hypothetical protein